MSSREIVGGTSKMVAPETIECYIRDKKTGAIKKQYLVKSELEDPDTGKTRPGVMVPQGYELVQNDRCVPFTEKQWNKMNNNAIKYGG